MKRFVAFLLVSICAIGSASFGLAEDEPKDPADKHSYWMKKKLEWSQAILGDLSRGDWEKMGKNARAMRALSKIEGRFRRTDQAEYRAQLGVFDQANAELIRAVDDENLEAATLAYMHLIHSCVNCHKELRADMPGEPSNKK